MDICEEFLESFRKYSFSDWTSELYSTFSNFDSIKIYGNSYDFGDFDKCLNFMSSHKNETVQGKYCSVQYYSTASNIVSVMPRESYYNQDWKNLDTKFGGAVCIPSSCDSNDLVPKLMKILLNSTDYVMSTDYIQEDFCQTKKHFQMTGSGIIGISFVLFLTILAIYSSIKSRKDDKSPLASFSLTRNTKNLFKDEQRDEFITYLRGIRSISNILTMYVHIIISSQYYPTSDPRKILDFHKGIFEIAISQALAGTSFCTMITIFLLTRAIWKQLERGSLNIPLLYVYRYFRIIPLIFFMMVVEKFIFQEWISTFIQRPFFFPNQFHRIYKFYWLPLLQIQNYFVDLKENFMPASYYFAVDMHLFMVTPFVIYLVWKWKGLRFVIFPLLIVIAFYFNISYIWENKEYFKNITYLSYEDKVLSRYIQETQFSMTAWIFGMAFGYFTILYPDIKIERHYSIWFAPVILGFITGSRTKIDFLKGYVATHLVPFDKIFHPIYFGIIHYSCHYGQPNLITKFLSHKFWIPFDRVGLSVFMAHCVLYRWMFITRRTPFEFTWMSLTEYYIYGLLVSAIYGLIMNLLIEQPVINIFKFYFRTSREKRNNL